jgi:hypothetical protein
VYAAVFCVVWIVIQAKVMNTGAVGSKNLSQTPNVRILKLKLDTQNNKLPNHSQINKQKVMGMF